MHRRTFLGGSAALAALGVPGLARAAAPGDLKFVFVFAQGGWDPTRVFATAFDNPAVAMEAAAEPATAGGIPFVDHPDRPSVRAFLQAWGARSVVFNGVFVRSIAHEICAMLAMTGTTTGLAPDWPAVLAAQDRARFVLPHLVLGGPSFPGDLGVAVARTGGAGQLEALLTGRALQTADDPARGPAAPAESKLDAYLARRAAARLDAAGCALDARLAGDLDTALADARSLKDLRWIVDFSAGGGLSDQVGVAVDALSLGLSRCVTVGDGGAFGWDTHTANDALQSPRWESLFAGLGELMAALAATPGETEPTLADETVVVVLSEMGRTPALNAAGGKDHWPCTSLMLVGPGLTGGRVIGGYDADFYSLPVDAVTGERSDAGQPLTVEAVGATLLALADVDPAAYVPGVDPIVGVMA